MSEISIVNKSMLLDKEIDVWGSIESPYFRALDVAAWIEIKNVPDLIKRVDADEVHRFNLCGLQGETWFLTEDGLYEVLLQSRKPIAKQFKKGVKQILHEIRTKGGYMVSKQEDTPEAIMARALKIADETLARNNRRLRELEATTEIQAQTIDAQERELKVAAPKVKFYDDTLASVDFLTISQIANELGVNADTLNKKLAECGIQHKQGKVWLLNKPYKEWNLHGTRTYGFLHSDGSNGTTIYTVWNQRGRRLIHALYNNDFNIKTALAEIKGELTKEATNDKNK